VLGNSLKSFFLIKPGRKIGIHKAFEDFAAIGSEDVDKFVDLGSGLTV
jgi:hypothetical protein